MATDHLGREIPTDAPDAQTVTEFAVKSGTLDPDTPGVQETLEQEKARAEAGTERAEQLSEQMAPEDSSTVPPGEGGGHG